jgi:hypothetical protein
MQEPRVETVGQKIALQSLKCRRRLHICLKVWSNKTWRYTGSASRNLRVSIVLDLDRTEASKSPISIQAFLTNNLWSIIFVHGLRGHPKHTWEGSRDEGSEEGAAATLSRRNTTLSTSTADYRTNEDRCTKVFWPDEYLTRDIPDARIWTYGYNADVIGGLFQPNNQNSVSQHGRDLAVRLDRDIGNTVGSIVHVQRLGWDGLANRSRIPSSL